MNRHGFISRLHEQLAPRTYLEIGINDGRGLARSRTRTIGVDPAFRVRVELACDLKLVLATSDDFFARPNPIDWFPEGVIDLTFVDGLHIFEFALRDFINAERLSAPTSVILLDDMLPRSVSEAARDRHTRAWTGDVYKVTQVLERFRPDLVVVPLDTIPTGLVAVAGLDPTNTVLSDNYDAILAEYAVPDPQDVPPETIHRTTAADPEKALSVGAWRALAAARSGAGLPDFRTELQALRGTADYTVAPPEPQPYPAKNPANKAAKQAVPARNPAKKTASAGPLRRIRRAVKRRL